MPGFLRGDLHVTRPSKIELGTFVLLAAAGIALRMYFEFIPNFAPVAALALFAGYFFASRWIAVALPLTVMLVTDWFIGGYHPAMRAVVYAALLTPVLVRGRLRSRFWLGDAHARPRAGQAAASTVGLVGCSLGTSAVFFLVTNFAHWAVYEMYEKSAAGLVHCYAAALPFFRYTLAGDLAFACLLFGGYAVAKSLAAPRKVQAVEKATV
jgi:hypothetical protein